MMFGLMDKIMFKLFYINFHLIAILLRIDVMGKTMQKVLVVDNVMELKSTSFYLLFRGRF